MLIYSESFGRGFLTTDEISTLYLFFDEKFGYFPGPGTLFKFARLVLCPLGNL